MLDDNINIPPTHKYTDTEYQLDYIYIVNEMNGYQLENNTQMSS